MIREHTIVDDTITQETTEAAGLVNNAERRHLFRYDGVLPENSTQNEVFEVAQSPHR